MAEDMLTQALQQLKDHKIRVTPQRQIILNYLITHHNHPSVETIYQELATQLPNLSLATVYNTLKLFVDLGIVIELQNGDAGTHYDFSVDHIITSFVRIVVKLLTFSNPTSTVSKPRRRNSLGTWLRVTIWKSMDYAQTARNYSM